MYVLIYMSFFIYPFRAQNTNISHFYFDKPSCFKHLHAIALVTEWFANELTSTATNFRESPS